ncbi:hypothetical protein [Roseimaritima sediminicola]|uniref:hypothetical protein n=1 Tax=Roseimaritima sediminicola TaxID=2662066 RepID=UPI001298309E|nr:hypothetical protein [Roseimaritima sediminicola]
MSQTEPGGPAGPDEDADEGVGWMPAVLASCLLLTIAMFVCCGVSTYFLFQQRVELASRTLRGHTIPTVAQSQLDPEEKQAVTRLLEQVADDAESGRLENWQASGVMNRLTRIPLLQWGDLEAIETHLEADPELDEAARAGALKDLSRLRHAILQGTVTSFDVNEVLAPVLVDDDSLRGQRLITAPDTETLHEVVVRARLLADREQVADRQMPAESIVPLLEAEIEAGKSEGVR